MSNPKIIYPAEPDSPPVPTLSTVAGGALGARTYYVGETYITPDGETVIVDTASQFVAANYLLKVTSPAAPSARTIASAYNIYVDPVLANLTRQTPTPIALGTDWTEPVTGLIAGPVPPPSWGATLTFLRPPTNVPNASEDAERVDTFSASGVRQSMWTYTADIFEFDMLWLAYGTEVGDWKTFLEWAVQGGAFDYYPDAAVVSYTTYLLEDKSWSQPYKNPQLYTLHCKFRKFVTGQPVASGMGPGAAPYDTPFTAPAAGAFNVAHGLGIVPSGALIQETSDDLVRWVDPPMYDNLYFYLSASGAGATGHVLSWK